MALRVYFSILLPVPPYLPPFFTLFRAIPAAKSTEKRLFSGGWPKSAIARRTGA
jgi:hypothetical protein